MLNQVADFYAIKESLLQALIKRVPSLRIGNSHCLELCAGPNCGKHTALADIAESLCKKAGGTVTLKFTPCKRMCGKGPNIKWDGKLYHHATEDMLKKLLEGKNE